MSLIKKDRYNIIFVLALAFILRLYGAFTVPLTSDEVEHITVSGTVSVSPGGVYLPLGSRETGHPLLSVYITWLSRSLFGGGRVSGRVPFIILSVLGIYFFYRLIKENRGNDEALLAALIISLSQYHIGWSRLISDTGLMLFFCPLILYLYFRFVNTKSTALLYLLGAAFGAGYLANETVFLLAPFMLTRLFCSADTRFVFKKKELYAGLLITAVIVSPSLYWNLNHNLANFRDHLFMIGGLGPGLMSLTLYLGEVFALFISPEKLGAIASVEHAFMGWLTGGLCLFAAALSLFRKKDAFVSFMVWLFWCVFVLFSVITVKFGLFMDNHWWPQITIFPGIFLCSDELTGVMKKSPRGRAFVICVLLCLLINALCFVNISENNFMPAWTGLWA